MTAVDMMTTLLGSKDTANEALMDKRFKDLSRDRLEVHK